MMFFHKKNRYELDMTTANNALQNILSSCNQPVNTIPFDKLDTDLRADLFVAARHRSSL